MNFTFGTPWFFLLLIVLPCLFWCKEHSRTFYFPKLEWIKKESSFFSLEAWLKVAIASFMIFALVKPFVYDSSLNKQRKGRDLILALDASGSMAQSGFSSKDRFKTKYDTSVELAKAFTKKRQDDNMGLVVFGTFAYSASPLTYDLKSLSYLLDMTTVGVAGESTAIGDAIVQSLRTLSFGEAKSKVVILLTDGYHNAGQNSPKQAVARAKELGVKIYTVGIGKKSDYDVALLKTIAKQSGAKSYAASSENELEKVFENIAKLEPSSIKSENYLNKKLLTMFPLLVVFGLLLAWVLYLRRGVK
jgi:Ca-activated chloride channel family protein